MGHSPVFGPYFNVGEMVTTIPGDSYAKRRRGKEIVQITSGVIAVNPASGGTQIVIASGNVTSITLAAGVEGQSIILALKQDGAGTSTWPAVIVNASLAGGAFMKSLAANASDVLMLTWIAAGGTWIQTAPMASNVS